MPKLVITHAVKDVETWLAGKEERAAMFGQFATNVTDHVAMDGGRDQRRRRREPQQHLDRIG